MFGIIQTTKQSGSASFKEPAVYTEGLRSVTYLGGGGRGGGAGRGAGKRGNSFLDTYLEGVPEWYLTLHPPTRVFDALGVDLHHLPGHGRSSPAPPTCKSWCLLTENAINSSPVT